MKKAVEKLPVLFLLVLSVLLFNGCKKEEPDTTNKVNQFIKDCFDVYYLWNDKTPKVNIKKEPDPFKLFEKLKYKEDKWSTLTNNVKGMEDSFSGEAASFGYSLIFGGFPGSNNYFAVVQYVYPNSPASRAGLKRGDIILQMNGTSITSSNARELLYGSALTLGMADADNNTIYPNGKTVKINSEKTYMNPVTEYKVIDKGAHRIGYLHYADYLLKSHEELRNVFNEFKDNRVTDVVLDLRYNGGGYSRTSQFLCSMLIDESLLDKKNIYLKQVWNSIAMSQSREEEVNTYFTRQIKYKGTNKKDTIEFVDVHMNLSKIYILTGNNTASASEATMVGLSPYMEVVSIGGTTHGKFCGGSILSPENIYNPAKTQWYNNIKNWGAYLMLFRYTNAENYPDHINGLVPSHYVEEDIIRNPVPLGDENEPLLAKAIELITGQRHPAPPTRASASMRSFRPAGELKIPAKPLDGKMIDIRPDLFRIME